MHPGESYLPRCSQAELPNPRSEINLSAFQAFQQFVQHTKSLSLSKFHQPVKGKLSKELQRLSGGILPNKIPPPGGKDREHFRWELHYYVNGEERNQVNRGTGPGDRPSPFLEFPMSTEDFLSDGYPRQKAPRKLSLLRFRPKFLPLRPQVRIVQKRNENSANNRASPKPHQPSTVCPIPISERNSIWSFPKEAVHWLY